ncbi:MAG: ATP-binding cassette domain-containing protein [Helicobacteraceae bacterium]|nr:ATP-binding cassette domain-containing protein [Helicobacteraceae bacterium]
MNILEVKSISHKFEYPLFTDVNFSLGFGESMAIIGVSGSGKSTLLHIISALLTPDSGEVKLLGKNLNSLNTNELTELRRDKLGLIFQTHYLFKGFSAKENLEVSAILSNRKIDQNILNELDIQNVIEQRVTELSGGQQQRVSIARVLTKKPRIIFADEPTGNLDSATASSVMNIFSEYVKKENSAMVLVTHDENLAFNCDHVYRLEDFKLLKVK